MQNIAKRQHPVKAFGLRLALGFVLAAAGLPMCAGWAQSVVVMPQTSRILSDDTAGRYAVLRGDKDTGCLVTLDDRANGPKTGTKGSFKAFLAPACRDSGIVIFDPVGWLVSQGQLTLIARNGHDIQMEKTPAGLWVKDPTSVRPLTLRKI